MLVGAAPSAAFAIDSTSLRGRELQRSLYDARTQLGTAPGRAGYELDRARRRVHELRVEAPRDPKVWHLKRELARLEARADRIERQQALHDGLRRLERGRERLPVPDFLRAPYATDLRGTALPIGTGKLFIFLQNSLRNGERQMTLGQAGLARRHLGAAEASLAALKATVPGEDPNVVAAERQIASLRARIVEAVRPG